MQLSQDKVVLMSNELDPEADPDDGTRLDTIAQEDAAGRSLNRPSIVVESTEELAEERNHYRESQDSYDARERKHSSVGRISVPTPLVVSDVDTEAIDRQIAEVHSEASGSEYALSRHRSSEQGPIHSSASQPSSPVSAPPAGPVKGRRASDESGLSEPMSGGALSARPPSAVGPRRSSVAALPTLQRGLSERTVARPRRATLEDRPSGAASVKTGGPSGRRSSALAIITGHADAAAASASALKDGHSPASAHTPVVGIAEVGKFQVRTAAHEHSF